MIPAVALSASLLLCVVDPWLIVDVPTIARVFLAAPTTGLGPPFGAVAFVGTRLRVGPMAALVPVTSLPVTEPAAGLGSIAVASLGTLGLEAVGPAAVVLPAAVAALAGSVVASLAVPTAVAPTAALVSGPSLVVTTIPAATHRPLATAAAIRRSATAAILHSTAIGFRFLLSAPVVPSPGRFPAELRAAAVFRLPVGHAVASLVTAAL
ncbi:hypothetical protein C446_06650 [Halobiforma nitratireducens JCM 10879]|uniref:Uncharacterized protein n=1 Tax=Halobiforma nitratireducens JCM 10879 TaxID=1227454 RepID=M0M5G2_9EURY|nr:hypothetical protein C446_06650 [Halobiforma nitratireducens JCM 10879]